MVQIVTVVAIAVKANVTTFNAFCIDEFALIGFDIVHILADALAGSVVIVIVENGLDVGDKVGVGGNLNDYIFINAGLLVIMPYHQCIYIVLCTQIYCDIL